MYHKTNCTNANIVVTQGTQNITETENEEFIFDERALFLEQMIKKYFDEKI